ncbi:hypothetical protein MTR_7g071780 [Medicago truncatula]|uniref:Uncharacterized protein n=1 Tax=Medicago truncatula TaxID=3880 RepID=G7KVY8_MEDTR|nr:hypothetical protein MTR_7g071780 [Medicago truncatula]
MGTRMGRGYPNPSGTWMGFNFSSPLDNRPMASCPSDICFGDGSLSIQKIMIVQKIDAFPILLITSSWYA